MGSISCGWYSGLTSIGDGHTRPDYADGTGGLRAHSVWHKQHGQLKTHLPRFSASHYRLPATFRNNIRTRAGKGKGEWGNLAELLARL